MVKRFGDKTDAIIFQFSQFSLECKLAIIKTKIGVKTCHDARVLCVEDLSKKAKFLPVKNDGTEKLSHIL